MSKTNGFRKLFRGETAIDFTGRWRTWFAISGIIIIVGLGSLALRGLNFTVDFKGGTVWQVKTTASVSEARAVIAKVNPNLAKAEFQQLTNSKGQKTLEITAGAKFTNSSDLIKRVSDTLANMAHTNVDQINVQGVGASWGSDVTRSAVKAVIIFLLVVAVYIWFRFEGKMALSALVALLHDILITAGIYSLSGFQVSPDTVIAFLTILGYSLYDTIVVFDKVEENTRSVASSNKMTYSDYVNLSMNQVLARSLNTSLVAVIPILSILVIGSAILGAHSLNDFGLALLIGLITGAYSSLFIASPLLALLKEREPRFAEIRRRIAGQAHGGLTPAAAAAGGIGGSVAAGGSSGDRRRPFSGGGGSSGGRRSTPKSSSGDSGPAQPSGPGDSGSQAAAGTTSGAGTGSSGVRRPSAPVRRPSSNRPSSSRSATSSDSPDGQGGGTAVPPRAAPAPRPRKKRKR